MSFAIGFPESGPRANNLGYSIYYWRTRSGSEVDFILYGEKGFKAIEVKRSANIRESDLKNLRTFRSDYPEADAYLFYGGTDERNFDGIKALPTKSALKQLDQII